MTATTMPDTRNGCAMTAGRDRRSAVNPLFAEGFARTRAMPERSSLVAEWDSFVQIRKARRGNCW
ncbi:MAG: hypothetical protein DMF87_24200 [Acidobacteria bacterium]|nr:MAG: hypothetical protein DMF88_00445 [Acidobacteriota bacterium]PYR73982.1 MAG: hypothetical protein DMF87_24200 [Acidobacteriota bacterium]